MCFQKMFAIPNMAGMCEFLVGYMMHIKPANTTIEIDEMLEICFICMERTAVLQVKSFE